MKNQEQSPASSDRREGGVVRAIVHGTMLAVCCSASYAIITSILKSAHIVSRDDELLGGMWAVIATIFVFRYNQHANLTAALSRVSATMLSLALCLVYLLIFPFHPWGMAALIGIGAIVLAMIGRSEDIITAGITTAVVMVVAGISPQHAWKEPILRLLDTMVGIAVGLAGSWTGLALLGRIPSDASAHLGDSGESLRPGTPKEKA